MIRRFVPVYLLTGFLESGKTTFYHFLKGMLYGMPRKRGRGAGKDSYARYEPWENPCSYGGTVWFKQAETKVRLYRNFARGQDGFEMVDLTRGRVLTEEDLESFLGGVSEAPPWSPRSAACRRRCPGDRAA